MILRGGYFFRRALRNMRQSPVLSLASVGTIAVALALLAFFAIAVLNVQQLTASWGETLAIVAYLDEVPEEGVVKDWIRANPNSSVTAFELDVVFTKKEETLLRERNDYYRFSGKAVSYLVAVRNKTREPLVGGDDGKRARGTFRRGVDRHGFPSCWGLGQAAFGMLASRIASRHWPKVQSG